MKKRTRSTQTAPAPTISAALLHDARAQARRLTALRAEFAKVTGDYAAIEIDILSALDRGARPEPGAPAFAVRADRRRSPKWKEAYVQAMGADAAVKVLAATPESVTRHLDFDVVQADAR